MVTDTGDIIDCMARMKGDLQPFAVATVVHTEDATSAKAGAKAVIRADGSVVGWIGGGCTLGAAKDAAAAALVDGRSRLIRIRPGAPEPTADGREEYRNVCPSGGTVELFIEPVLPRPALVIAGASPTAQALCDLAIRVGFAVSVAGLASDAGLFPNADRRIDGFALAELPRIGSAFVVVAAQGRRDREALAAALAAGARYVAFVASRQKAAKLKQELVASGLAADRVATLRAPAGIDIGAATPEEIAVSILADVIRERRQGVGAREGQAAAAPVAADMADSGAVSPGDCCSN
ncbi:MAG: XdhC family protein [Pseudomonadota bacterium]